MNNESTGNTTLNTSPDVDNPVTTAAFWDGAVIKMAGQPIGTIKGRGKQKAQTKTPTAIRLSPEVIDYFTSTGKGWQTRMDNVLREYVKAHVS